MAKKKIGEIIEEMLCDFLAENGYELYNTEFVKEGRDWFLRVYVDILTEEECKALESYFVTYENEDGEEEDPRQELVEQLLEYKLYKYMANELKDRECDSEYTMFKESSIPDEVLEYEEPVDMDALIGDLTLKKLNVIFQDVMKRQVNKIDPVRSKFGKIQKEEVTLPDKLLFVTEYAKSHQKFSFRALLNKQSSKTQIVVTFLAILQLMKEGTISIEQEQPFDDIMITSQI